MRKAANLPGGRWRRFAIIFGPRVRIRLDYPRIIHLQFSYSSVVNQGWSGHQGTTTIAVVHYSLSVINIQDIIGQLGRLQYRLITCVNPISLVEPRANSGFIRISMQCGPISLCINRPERLERAMNRSIQSYMSERNSLDPPSYPNDILDFNDTQTIMNYSDCGGTLVARPTLVHNTAIRKLKMDYPWIIQPNSNSGSKY
ncbi:MAG: hypothetical protein EZS28_037487, partial [Streblomastix strix]